MNKRKSNLSSINIYKSVYTKCLVQYLSQSLALFAQLTYYRIQGIDNIYIGC